MHHRDDMPPAARRPVICVDTASCTAVGHWRRAGRWVSASFLSVTPSSTSFGDDGMIAGHYRKAASYSMVFRWRAKRGDGMTIDRTGRDLARGDQHAGRASLDLYD